MKKLILLFLLASLPALAAVPVSLAPIPQFFALDSSGRPLSFGCVFTYSSNSTTPLTTYTDYSGNTVNPNPVILNAAGSANIWLSSGVSYSLKVVASGGTNCQYGATRYTVNGIGGGTSQLTSNVSASATPQFTAIAQNQLFLFTLTSNAVSLPLVVNNVQAPSLITFQISENVTGGYTFAWPANTIGGALVDTTPGAVTTQMFIWNGTTATAIGPAVSGQTVGGPIIRAGNAFLGTVQAGGSINSAGAIAAGGQLSGASLSVNGFQPITGWSGLTGTKLASVQGSLTALHTVQVDVDGDLVDAGSGPTDLQNCGTTTTCSHTLATLPLIVRGTVVLAAGTATVTGFSPGFTGTSNFNCTTSDNTTVGNGSNAIPASASSITLTGTGTDTISYICVGD